MPDDTTPIEPDDSQLDQPVGFDISSLLGAAQEMGAKMADAQAEIESTTVVGSAANGNVSVSLDGAFQCTDVSIDPALVDPADVQTLEDLIMVALRDAVAQVTELQSQANPMAGMDLGSLGSMFGQGND